MATPPNMARTGSPDTNIMVEPDSQAFGELLAKMVQDLNQGNQGRAFNLHYSNVAIAYTHLYGFDIEGVGANAAVVSRSGDQGTIAELRIPAAAGQLTKVWNLVVGPELAWTAVATTTDYASEAQAITAKNALQYFWFDQGVSTKAKGAAFEGMAFAEAAMHIPWDDTLGEEIGVDESGDAPRIIHAGDIAYRPVSTWNILRDPSLQSYDDGDWGLIREWPNKFNVAATCADPETAQAALSSTAQYQSLYWQPFNLDTNVRSNRIPVYYLYHKRTPALPTGRQTVFLENGAIISDGPLSKAFWKQLPIVRFAAGEYSGTAFPYSKFSGVLGAAQAADALYKDLLTNATATSGAIISAEDDDETPPLQLGGGPKVLYRRKGTAKPEALQLQQAHPEHFNLVAKLRGESQQIMGLDSLTAGQEIGANLSGAAMALMTSTSVQNNSQLQARWAKFVQDIGNVTLAHIQHNMKTPRRIALAGRSRADLVVTTELSGDKVAGIDRLQAQLGPALQQTDAGKFELAQLMLKQGWAQTPQQLQTVMDTGRLDAMTQDLSSELMLIQSENEALSRGEQVQVMLGDDHVLHLKGHRPVTASITARKDKAVIDALQAHENMHLDILKKTDPATLKLFGQPSLAPPPQAAPQGPPPPPPMSDATKLGVASLAVKQGWAPTPQAAESILKTGDITAGGQQPPQLVGGPSPQAQAQAAGPSLPTNPANGRPVGPVAGTIPPALAVKPS